MFFPGRVIREFFEAGSRSRPRRAAPRTRPGVEKLEDRLVPSGVDVVTGDPKDWPMYNHDPEGTRYNHAETQLGPGNVGGLEVLWRYETAGAIAGTPAVVNDIIYAADSTGTVYAVNRDGTLRWSTTLPIPFPFPLKLTASPLVTNRTVIIGDLAGQIHGLDADDGHMRWTMPLRPPSPNPVFGDQHPFQSIFGSATMVGNLVAIGTASVEEPVTILVPGYPCCTFRGSLVLLDPSDGHIIWQSFTVVDVPTLQPDDGDPSTPPEFAPSGAGIWSTPTYDRASNTIYATTGNNYSQPTTDTSDAIIAFDASDGHIKWAAQMTENDFWNYRFPPQEPGDPPDFDFGDSPQIYKINGRTVVGAGQKSGFYHVVDAETGDIINQFQATATGGNLGGLFADSAVAGGVVYANGSDWPDPFGTLPLPAPYNGGSLSALKADGSGELWSVLTPAPNISGVAVANGVVYFSSIDGTFYALDAADGTILAQVDTSFPLGEATIAGVSSGPSVSRGRIYVGLGDTLTSAFNAAFVPPGGAILALGLPDSDSLLAEAPGSAVAPAALTADQAAPLLAEAIARWQAAGADVSSLANVQIAIADLQGTILGQAIGRTIVLDVDAAGWGWFIDPTPRDDSEFSRPGDQGEEGRMDLLTALMHEVGHILGHDHDEGGVMHETLAAGTRIAPAPGSILAAGAWDGSFASVPDRDALALVLALSNDAAKRR
jgi:polyvinyl alcohol dehydrogenase (cytochrome)